MSIQDSVRESLERSFVLSQDLVQSLEEGVLKQKLPQLRSNTIGLQFWCIVGARESYAKAIAVNQWSGFSCSLENPERKEDVGASLQRSSASVSELLGGLEEFSEVQNRLVIDLLEHEAAHQGQLIRYLYGLGLEIPKSWKERFNLS